MTFEKWLESNSLGYDHLDAAKSAWEAATAAERERCAVIVEGNYGWTWEAGCSVNLSDLIRRGT